MVSSLFLLRRYHRPQRHDPRRDVYKRQVQVQVGLIKDAFHIYGSFQAADTEASYSLHIIIDPVNLEVTVID